MKFREYKDSWAIFKKMGIAGQLGITTRRELYEYFLNAQGDVMAWRHGMWEQAWNDACKPYYDVYPGVIPVLTRLKLDKVVGDLIHPPGGQRDILLRMPIENSDLTEGENSIESIFVSFQKVNKKIGGSLVDGIVIGMSLGEKVPGTDIPVFFMRIFPLDERPVEEAMNSLRIHHSAFVGDEVPMNLADKAVRLALTICLIDNNPELISPEILVKDRGKPVTDKLVDKAIRRGKFGFTIGKKAERSPHYRMPHVALFWTGPGRKIPKIGPRKGSLVHREKVEQIPTGFEE